MSFMSGSVWEMRLEEQERLDRIRLDQLHFLNPSLSWDDVRLLLKQEKEKKVVRAKCCACSSSRKEIVRVGNYLGPCQCQVCHLA